MTKEKVNDLLAGGDMTRMLRPVTLHRLLTAAVLLLFLSSHAHAATIELLFTFFRYTPTIDVTQDSLYFHYVFFESATNDWPGSPPPQPFLADGNALLPVSFSEHAVSFEAASLSDVYFAAYGGFPCCPEEWERLLYAAAPPTGPIPDESAYYFYGPPWISLAHLGDGFSGELQFFYGTSIGPLGYWQLTPVSVPAVPEPASFILLGSGIAALAASRHRNRKRQARTMTPPSSGD